jgi:Fe2+ transport system protein FeoA
MAEDQRALSDLPPGAQGVVRAVHGDADFITLLAARGMIAGAQLSVLRNSGYSPLLIMIRDTCLALGLSAQGPIHELALKHPELEVF